MAELIKAVVYGTFTPFKKEPRRHKETYIEYQVPVALEKKIHDFIEREMSEFLMNCKCPQCKKDRSPLNKPS